MLGAGAQLGGGAQLGVGSQQLGTATPEQLESLYKQLAAANTGSGLGTSGGGSGASSDQVDSLQKHIFEKQMLALLEQQKLSASSIPIPGLVGTTHTNLAALSQATPTAIATGTTTSTSPASSVSPGGAEIFQMPPLFLLNLSNQTAPPFGSLATSSSSPAAITSAASTLSSSTTASNNSGLSAASLGQLGLASLPLQPSGLSVAAREPLSLVPGGGGGGAMGGATGGIQQRRPLSESLSAPGFQTGQEQPSLDSLQKQHQLQHQQLLSQSHQIHQHYLDQQQR